MFAGLGFALPPGYFPFAGVMGCRRFWVLGLDSYLSATEQNYWVGAGISGVD